MWPGPEGAAACPLPGQREAVSLPRGRWVQCCVGPIALAPDVRAQSFSRVRLFVTPWAGARSAPLSVGFSRQQYWSRLPFPPPGGLPDPGIKLASPVSPESAGGVLSAASLQSFSVAVFICGTWRVSTAKVGLLKWRGLKLAVGRQEGPTDLVLSLAIL